MAKCAREGCDKEGTLQPILMLRTKSNPDVAAKGALDFRVCAEHAKELGTEDFVTDESWAKVVHIFEALRKEQPSRELTTVEFREEP